MNVIIAPDSFKGSLSATDVATAIAQGIERVCPNAVLRKIPMADGGEGTVEAMLTAVGGTRYTTTVRGPLGEPVAADWAILSDHKTGIIEMAAASGLPLVPLLLRNPLFTSSYGTGELIRKVVEAGCEKLIIGIGGSATNDGGMGMLQALGVSFFDASGKELGPGGGELSRLSSIETDHFMPGVKQLKILVSCDVTNPLCGPTGASHVFGPQKGATPSMVETLDAGLKRFAQKALDATGMDTCSLAGAGAAGGMGAGLVAFLGATLMSGVEIVRQAAGLDDAMASADLVFTGEGRTDKQTLYGKVPFGVAAIAKKYEVPVVCLSGGLGEELEDLYTAGICALFSIVDGPMTLEAAMGQTATLLASASENIMRLFLAGHLKN